MIETYTVAQVMVIGVAVLFRARMGAPMSKPIIGSVDR